MKSIVNLVIYAGIALCLALQSCGPSSPGVYKTDRIKSGKRDDFHKLNNELFKAIKANNVHDAESLMSKELLATNDHMRTIELASLQSQLGAYEVLDEYYIVNEKSTDTHKLNTTTADGNKYSFYVTALAQEMYIAFIVPKTKGDKYIITAVYCKYNYGWKLNDLSLQPYTITGKTAPQLYQLAMGRYDKGYLIDAYTDMELADKNMRPNQFWLYPQDSLMLAFHGKVAGVVSNYRYPLIISKVPTQPKIFEITHQTSDEGVFPAVYYLTSINIKDPTALKIENDNIRKAIGAMFPGIDKDKKYIYFSAFNKLPNGKSNPPSYDWEYKLF